MRIWKGEKISIGEIFLVFVILVFFISSIFYGEFEIKKRMMRIKRMNDIEEIKRRIDRIDELIFFEEMKDLGYSCTYVNTLRAEKKALIAEIEKMGGRWSD